MSSDSGLCCAGQRVSCIVIGTAPNGCVRGHASPLADFPAEVFSSCTWHVSVRAWARSAWRLKTRHAAADAWFTSRCCRAESVWVRFRQVVPEHAACIVQVGGKETIGCYEQCLRVDFLHCLGWKSRLASCQPSMHPWMPKACNESADVKATVSLRTCCCADLVMCCWDISAGSPSELRQILGQGWGEGSQ